MTTATMQKLDRARSAIMAGKAPEAVQMLESFMRHLEDGRIVAEDRDTVEARLQDLRQLAEAAVAGTRLAVEQINAAIRDARALQTYDSGGRRRTASAVTDQAKRY